MTSEVLDIFKKAINDIDSIKVISKNESEYTLGFNDENEELTLTIINDGSNDKAFKFKMLRKIEFVSFENIQNELKDILTNKYSELKNTPCRFTTHFDEKKNLQIELEQIYTDYPGVFREIRRDVNFKISDFKIIITSMIIEILSVSSHITRSSSTEIINLVSSYIKGLSNEEK